MVAAAAEASVRAGGETPMNETATLNASNDPTSPDKGAPSTGISGLAAEMRVAAADGVRTVVPGISIEAISFSDMPGWAGDDQRAALHAFLVGCEKLRDRFAGLGVSGRDLAALCGKVNKAKGSRAAARAFFEREFVPVWLFDKGAPLAGFVTGYFEPAIPGSRVRTDRFTVPLYRKLDDLVKITAAERRTATAAGIDPEYVFAPRTATGGLTEYPDRPAIEAGALSCRGLEIAWVEDPIDAFFIHVQGSARLQLADGSVMRLAYAAKSGQPYTAIGRILIARGEIARQDMTMETLRAWLEAHRNEARALIDYNRSFIFFREMEGDADAGPEGAAGVPLTPGRSLAVDRKLHAFGTPIYVEADLPKTAGGHFAQLMIAQDTGSAIVGPARGNIFVGTGVQAGRLAGEIKHGARFTVLAPRGSRLARASAQGEHR
ncbi:MltA domain-containing protein [Breoghania sp.]|uniref:murein transglycosylase A n=1 Tax=Breoghania sp. TaxID=2065378 RepID=UPI0026174A9C|nr:MltA domain-containing protein [Breoghania sp.]MDJ0933600.1 MltA domain-containing protein [Breoghania sp.]